MTLYGNNASAGTDYLYAIDPATGAVLDEFTTRAGNGRGVVVVGDTLYYTLAGSGSVFSYNLAAHTDNGALFSVAGSSGLSTIAYDGTNFWIGDYTGTNKAYNYSPTGTLLSTINLKNCTGFCDGLEYFLQNGQGRLISNQSDAPSPGVYDVYDTSGNLLTAGFIKTTFASTGIAFDGTNFYVSEIFNGRIGVYNGATGAFISDEPISKFKQSPLVEDLSFNYQQTLPPPPGVPEPATLVTLGSGLLAVVLVARRRKKA